MAEACRLVCDRRSICNRAVHLVRRAIHGPIPHHGRPGRRQGGLRARGSIRVQSNLRVVQGRDPLLDRPQLRLFCHRHETSEHGGQIAREDAGNAIMEGRWMRRGVSTATGTSRRRS